MACALHCHPRKPGGFSLVEILVSVAIGMFAVAIMMQQLSVFETNKRTTTGGADAQNNGVIALLGLQRDIRQSGYDITSASMFTCNAALQSGGTIPVRPLIINPATTVIPAGDLNTDTLLVMYGNSNGQPQGNGIDSQSVGVSSNVKSPTMFAVGDIVMAVPAACGANLLPRPVTAVAAPTITAATGAGETLYNLGSAPSILAYAVRNGNLTVCNYMTTNCGLASGSVSATVWAAMWVPIANNIVSMRAQYGVDTNTPMDGAVDAFNQTTPATSCGWAKVSAVRLALVARNSQINQTAVTLAPLTWDGSAGAPIDLTANSEWGNYRYRVFQTVVPMRNLAWLGLTTGC
ncbi:MAG: PilW family protein [Betaproteobacteria bacterium]